MIFNTIFVHLINCLVVVVLVWITLLARFQTLGASVKRNPIFYSEKKKKENENISRFKR